MDVFANSGLYAQDILGRVTLSREEIERFNVKVGDIFFTRTSETVDEIGMSSVLLEDLENGVFSGFVLKGRPIDNRIKDIFKKYCFSHSTVRSQIVSTATYTTRALTNGRLLSKVWIALPPGPEEQEAIAESLSDVDGLIGALEKLIAKKRAVKQAAMQQLLPGKTRLPGFSNKWIVKRLGDFASIRNHKVMPSTVPERTLCVELEHLEQATGRLIEASTAGSSNASKYSFLKGDVLFGRLRSYLRKYWQADRDGICSTEIWPLVVDPVQALSGFLYALVQTQQFVSAANISYGTHMPRADWAVMKELKVPMPTDLNEQMAVATVLSDMDAEIKAIERHREKAKQIKQGMMQQLLTGRVRLVNVEATT